MDTGPIPALQPQQPQQLQDPLSTRNLLRIALVLAPILLGGTLGTSYLGSSTAPTPKEDAVLMEVQTLGAKMDGVQRQVDDLAINVEAVGDVVDDASEDVERVRRVMIHRAKDEGDTETLEDLEAPRRRTWKDRVKDVRRRRSND